MNSLIFSLILVSSISFAAERQYFESGEIISHRIYSRRIDNFDGSVTFKNPKIRTNFGTLPVKAAESKELCNAFGFNGSLPYKTKFGHTDGVKMLKLYTSLHTEDPMNYNANTDYSVSANLDETNGINRDHFQFATEVTCANLEDLF